MEFIDHASYFFLFLFICLFCLNTKDDVTCVLKSNLIYMNILQRVSMNPLCSVNENLNDL